MEYDVILRNGNYALISTECNYIVACGYDPTQRVGEQWGHGIYFTFGNNPEEKAIALYEAINCYMSKITEKWMTFNRLSELATLFKDGLLEDDKEFALEYFDSVCEMTESEKEFFGIEMESEEE